MEDLVLPDCDCILKFLMETVLCEPGILRQPLWSGEKMIFCSWKKFRDKVKEGEENLVFHFQRRYCTLFSWMYSLIPWYVQRRQSGLKTGGVMGPGLKTEGVVGPGLKTGVSLILKIQHTETRSTVLTVSFPEFSFNYIKIFYFWNVATFGKSSHCMSLYIIGYIW